MIEIRQENIESKDKTRLKETSKIWKNSNERLNTKKELLRTASRDYSVTAKVVTRKISAGLNLLARKI